MARTIRISSVQLPAVLPGRNRREKNAANLRSLRKLLRVAGDRHSDLALLGEYANLWHHGTSESRREYAADPIPGPITKAVCTLAKKYRMNIALPMLGTFEGVKGSYVVLIDRRGSIAGAYLKSHPIEAEQQMGMAAGSSLPVFQLDCARVGVMTCMDIEYPEVAQVLMLEGAQLLLFPHVQAGWGEPDWEIRYRARAIDTGLYLASACYGYPEGEWSPGKMLGRSGVVGPDGTILADAGRRVGVITRDIDLDERRITHFFFTTSHPRADAVKASRRPELYTPLTDPRITRKALKVLKGKR
ncbi:MAG TPA: carbon-nitrogen hydrolase family protein [Bacteroidota bacterium]